MKIGKIGETMKVEDVKIDRLSITAFFFDGKSAKINAYIEKEGSDKSAPICFDIKRKGDVKDLLLFCPDWEKILALNDIEFQQTKNHARAYHHRISQAINNDISDVITLAFFPIVIENIYLDWEAKMKEDGTIEVLLTNFNKP